MRLLKITGLFLLVVLLLLTVAVAFFGGPIAKAVVKEINKRSPTEIVIADYDVGVLRSFPALAVNLQQVRVQGTDGSELLVAEEVSCRLDLSSLFGKIRVEEVVISEGRLQMLADVDGNTNYQLTGYTSVKDQARAEEASTSSSTAFAVADASLRNVEVLYRDDQLRIDFAGIVKQAAFQGDFGTDNYLLSAEATLEAYHLDQEGTRYLSQQPLVLSTQTSIDNRQQIYTFAPLEVTTGDLVLNVIGDLATTREGLRTNLRLESTSGSLDDVLGLIPPAFVGGLNELETKGELSLTTTVAGAWTQRAYPRIDGRLTFTDGRVGSPRTNIGARELNLRASFTYTDGIKGGAQQFAIEELTGLFRRQRFRMSLRVEDMADPTISFAADGAFPLGTLPALLGESPLTDGDGFVRIDNLRLSGRYADMRQPRTMGRVAVAGRLALEEGEITLNEKVLRFPAGQLELRQNELEVAGLSFTGPGTDIAFTGRATNLIPVLFADSLNTNDTELDFVARLSGTSLDLDELLALAGPTESEEERAAATGQTDSLRARTIDRRTQITDLLRGRFDADLRRWNYGEVEGEDFRGQLTFRPGRLEVAGVTRAMEGEVKIDGAVIFDAFQRVEGRISCENVAVEQFFGQAENFGQEVLTDDNLRGKMDARLLIKAWFDETGQFDYDKLRVLAGISIMDGELRDFGMLENFAFALKAGDLRRVRFTKLQNYFEITEQTLYIPLMFIQSSALNLEISGNHTFTNFLDYYVKVNAGQAITNKIKRHDRALEVLPARRNGFFNLYYTVYGPLEEYAVASNKRAVKDDFRRSLVRKGNIRRALAEAFSEPIELVDEPSAENEDSSR